jgi:hypothetical protein
MLGENENKRVKQNLKTPKLQGFILYGVVHELIAQKANQQETIKRSQQFFHNTIYYYQAQAV